MVNNHHGRTYSIMDSAFANTGIVTRIRLPLVLLLVALVSSGFSSARAAEQSFDQLFEQALQIVLRNHPTLVSQRSLVASGEDVDLSRSGMPLSLSLTGDVGTRIIDEEVRFVPMVGMSVSLPIIDPDRAVDQAAKRRALQREIEGDIQQLQTLQEEVLGIFTDQVFEILSLQHGVAGKQELLSLLQRRRRDQEELVRGGANPEPLWALDERLADLQVELRNLQRQQEIALSRTAYNFGGDQHQQLKERLQKLILFSEVTNIHE